MHVEFKNERCSIADFAMLDPDLRKRTRTKLAGREREREEMTSVLLVIGYDGFW